VAIAFEVVSNYMRCTESSTMPPCVLGCRERPIRSLRPMSDVRVVKSAKTDVYTASHVCQVYPVSGKTPAYWRVYQHRESSVLLYRTPRSAEHYCCRRRLIFTYHVALTGRDAQRPQTLTEMQVSWPTSKLIAH